MTRGKSPCRGVLGTLLGIGLLLALAATACAANFNVIANKDVPAASLSKAELQAIFLGEKVRWEGKQYVKIVVPEDEALCREFYQAVLGKTVSQFDTHWSKLVFSGRAMLPKSFSDQSKLVDYVANQKGAISFVPAGQAVGSAKVVTIK